MNTDPVTFTLKAVAWFVAVVGALFALSIVFGVIVGDWPRAGIMLLWTVGMAALSATFFTLARVAGSKR